MKRVGIIAFLHESNTFSTHPTTIKSFAQDLLLTGEAIRTALENSHHEVGGFFAGLVNANAEAVPIFAARALPSGTIDASTFNQLVDRMLKELENAGDLDGILVAPHGATVSEEHPDADGYWLQRLRSLCPNIPIIGTLDAHTNLSPLMVESCVALIAYRTNPHLDQKQRGMEAADLLVRTLRGECQPTMAAAFPPMAISIESQCTDETHLRPLYELADQQLQQNKVLSNSILLGFPYADVEEMGSATIVVTDNDRELAVELSQDLARKMWSIREDCHGPFVTVEEALDRVASSDQRYCLLDMGDNVGGGSAADGTELVAAIHKSGIVPAFACLFDPEAVRACEQAGIGNQLEISVGGKTDGIHGEPVNVHATVRSLHAGRFKEPNPRHGGFVEFDQGKTAIIETDSGLTLMLTTRRMVPFSLEQLRSCDIDPLAFRILVAKGVNAPIAAYREAVDDFIRVNTGGSTCADMTRLNYQHRRRPMFPFEPTATFN